MRTAARACLLGWRIPYNPGEEIAMPDYIPSPRQWVRDQVDLYEKSGAPRAPRFAIRACRSSSSPTPATRRGDSLMRVQDGARYVLVGSMGGAPTNPVWVHNLRANQAVEIRDLAAVQSMRVREVEDEAERARLWALAVAAFPPYAEYQSHSHPALREFVES
jgi:F420H(2)-dependent quinone reductase